MEHNNNTPNEAPLIPESEMKLPEESVNGVPQKPVPKNHLFNPLLITLLIVLLVILAAVIIWGEELIGMVWPQETVELQPLSEGEASNNEVSELEQWESEIDNMDLSEIDAEMTSIEARIEAEITASSTVE